MPKKSIAQRYPLLILGIFFVGWLILPVGFKTFLRFSIFEFQAPSRQTASVIRDVQDYWALRTTSRNVLLQDLTDLARLNNYYEATRFHNDLAHEELVRLRRLFDLPSQREFHYEVARVVQRESGTWWHQMTIRKGRNHDIPVGAPVIFAGGVVGRIKEVHLSTSVVELITSPNLRLSARLDNDLRPIAFQGGINEPFRAPRGRADYLSLDISLAENESRLILTSGLGGIFPEGLVIGRLQSLELRPDALFQTGEVMLDDRLLKLREVAVLIPVDQN